MRRFGRKAAFTIVELLVVVSIISVLAALLLPALEKAQESARRAFCASNLKQLGVGLQLYVADSGGDFFPTPITLNNCTFQVFSGYSGTNFAGLGHLLTYMDASVDVYYCLGTEWPSGSWGGLSGSRKNFRNRTVNTSAISNYAFGLIPIMNGKLANNGPTYPAGTSFKLGSLRDNPAILADLKPDYSLLRISIANHQVQGFNVAYLDGHARWMPASLFPPTVVSGEDNGLQWAGHQGNKKFWETASGYPAYSFH